MTHYYFAWNIKYYCLHRIFTSNRTILCKISSVRLHVFEYLLHLKISSLHALCASITFNVTFSIIFQRKRKTRQFTFIYFIHVRSNKELVRIFFQKIGTWNNPWQSSKSMLSSALALISLGLLSYTQTSLKNRVSCISFLQY